MSQSSLVDVKIMTTHFGYPDRKAGRGGAKIDKIFVHHMAGVLTAEQCGNVFKNREASAHYGVDYKGRIGQYVLEENAAWHCGNKAYNMRSIGIELSNDGGAKTGWHVSDKTIARAIDLIADICKRNGISKLNYTGDLKGNLCMHRWVASTSCPGPYLSKQFNRIANGVNSLLNAKLDVDGIGGPLTVTRMQEFFGTMQDGVISGQKKEYAKYYPALTAVEFDDTTSTCVQALQKFVGVKQTGVLDEATVKAWQKKLGVAADGDFNVNSMKAWQTYLNSHDKVVYDEAPKKEPKPVTETQLYRVRKSWVDAKSQVGAYKNLDNAKKACDGHPGYSVYDKSGKKLYTSPVKETIVDKELAACKVQADWMKNAKYEYEKNPTVAKSKKRGTCVTYESCVLQRIGLIPSGQSLWHDENGKVYGANSNFTVIYPKNKTLSQLKNELKAGDIVMDGHGVGSGSHIFILTGEWKGNKPVIWDNWSGQKKQGAHTYDRDRHVIAIVRPK